MENPVVIAATSRGEIELFSRGGAGGTLLTLLGRWERQRRVSWELAATLVAMLQALVEAAIDMESANGPAYAVRLVDVGLCAVDFERTYK